jgi:hypothetical protein
MMVATFGDLAGPGSLHLDAGAALRDSGLRGQPTAAQEASRLAVTLSRYLADIVPLDEVGAIASGQADGWERAVVDAREALKLAAASLRPAAAAEPALPDAELAGPLAAHLGAAARSLTAGRDLLRTHFSTGAASPDRSHWSRVITSAPVTRALLEEIARWSQQLAFLTGRLSVAPAADAAGPAFMPQGMASACHWLLVAEAAIHAGTLGIPLDAEDTGLLMAIPVNAVPPRRAPAGPETATVLCQGIEGSAIRLRAVTFQGADEAAWSPAMTADSWRWSATAAAVTCHINNRMLLSLAEWGRRDLASGAGMQLGYAAQSVAQACARWREVAAAWNEMTTETAGLTGPGIADVSDLVVRTGRLAFADPEWLPDRARRSALRDPADLAPDAAQATAIAGAVHQATDALARMADSDLRAVGAAVGAERLYVRTRTLPDECDVPYRYGHAIPAHTRDLLKAYKAAADASARAVAALDTVAITLNAPSQVLAAARSAVHRAPDPAMSRGAGRRPAGPASSAGRRPSGPRLPGPVEHTLRKLGTTDSIRLLRAMAIDKAAAKLIAEASASVRQQARRQRVPGPTPNPPASTPAGLASRSFPQAPAAVAAAGERRGAPAQPLRPRSARRRPLPHHPGRS